jgi:cytochrome c oxidase subunit III
MSVELRQPVLLDVSRLPAIAFDARAPVWWGNLLMMFIETMTVALLVTSYFYLCQASDDWPPPNPNRVPPLVHPLPDLLPGTINTLVLLVSAAPMVWADWASRRLRLAPTLFGLLLVVLLGIAAIVLRCYEFPAMKFRWDDNAYGSTVWAILGLHLTYLILGVLESALLVVWILMHGLDEKHAVDATLTASYWYWAVGVWLVLYPILYWTPRLVTG